MASNAEGEDPESPAHAGDLLPSNVTPGQDDDVGDSTRAAAGSQQSTLQSHASSAGGSPRRTHLARAQVQRIQNHQKEHDKPLLSAEDILRLDVSMLRGLTPPPWPADFTPHKKRPRTVDEVIKDNSPRDKDKLLKELEEMHHNNKRKKTDLPSRTRSPAAGPSDRGS